MKNARIFLALAFVCAGTCFAGPVHRTEPAELIVVTKEGPKATTLSAMPSYAIAAPMVAEIAPAYCEALTIAPVMDAVTATTPTVGVKEKTTVAASTDGYCYKRVPEKKSFWILKMLAFYNRRDGHYDSGLAA